MKKPKSKAYRRRNLVIRLYVLLLTLILGLAMTALLSQTAFATTYVITDGDRVVTYTSFATDPAEVLGQAGLELSEHDTYTTAAVEGGSTITINRAQRITINYHGQTTQTTTFGETAGELLSRLNLDVSGEDVVSHGMDELTFDGMELSIDRVETVRETYTTTVPHEVSHCNDSTIPEGMEEVLTEGVDGELLCTADVTYVNGREVSRTVLSETVTRAPTTEIIGVGTGETLAEVDPDAMPIIGDGYIILPTGEVLTYTHKDTVRATAYTHTDAGCDLITSTGTTVRWGTVAVDPRYIPYGTRMFIMASDGSYIYGIATAEDCGGDIKGDRMDLYMPTYSQCMEFGRRRCTLYFLG
ncbi:MAG: G5 domain-containing protein [Oscillospiraceae bacterium]|nr:G5 domain-containing protein [Oscillospiraceae bacterium]